MSAVLNTDSAAPSEAAGVHFLRAMVSTPWSMQWSMPTKGTTPHDPSLNIDTFYCTVPISQRQVSLSLTTKMVSIAILYLSPSPVCNCDWQTDGLL